MKNMSSTNEEMLRFKSNWKKVKMMGIIILGLIVISIVSIHLKPNQTKSQKIPYKVVDKSKKYYRLLFYVEDEQNGLSGVDSIMTSMKIPDSCVVSLYKVNDRSSWDWEAVIRY